MRKKIWREISPTAWRLFLSLTCNWWKIPTWQTLIIYIVNYLRMLVKLEENFQNRPIIGGLNWKIFQAYVVFQKCQT